MKAIIKKYIFILIGIFFMILGVIGLIIPVIPQVPFFVLGVVFLSAGSKRLHRLIRKTTLYDKYLKKIMEKVTDEKDWL